jgi:hypothetical protein
MTYSHLARFQFTSSDGLSIACVRWDRHGRVRGAEQIAHGLDEHIGRYAELAGTLINDGFVVYVFAACRSERDPEGANGSSHIHFLRKRQSSWTKVGRSACAHRPLSRRGYYVSRPRFLSRRPARNAPRTESPRRFHKSARLDFRHPGRGIVNMERRVAVFGFCRQSSRGFMESQSHAGAD